MQDAKYIVLKDGKEMVVFPPSMKHDDVARSMVDPRMPVKEQVLSAGFCTIWAGFDDVQYSCYGESYSLGLQANDEEDTSRLKRLFSPTF